jgi:hypothetical protein
MNVNEYLEATRHVAQVMTGILGGEFLSVRPRIVCVDGLSFSVQAGIALYCAPRESRGPYSSVEIGFPSDVIPEIMEWAETPATPLETVYGWVPVEVVDAVIAAHGGIANVPQEAR